MKKKLLIAIMCVAALVIGSVFGTMAYLTDTESVANIFTVGKVGIELFEHIPGADGKLTKTETTVGNKYDDIVPGGTYYKDPTIRVDEDSEDCWLFVKIENGLAPIEAVHSNDYNTVSEQLAANGWTQLIYI